MTSPTLEIHNPNPCPTTPRSPSLTLTSFGAHTLKPSVPVYLPWNLTSREFHALLLSNPEDCKTLFPQHQPNFGFPALREWLSRLLDTLSTQSDEEHAFHAHPYKLRKLDIESVDWWFEGRLGFMKLQAEIRNDEEEDNWIPGAVFLRGGSVAVLILIHTPSSTEPHVLLTLQPRIAASTLSFTEIPAGMLDDSGNLAGKAAQEISEEAHLTVHHTELLNMSELATENSLKEEGLRNAMYPSPGACDEFIPLFLCQKRLTSRHMEWLEGRVTGLGGEGERITLKLGKLSELWKVAARDGKALAALALYEGLKREGRIPDVSDEVEREPEGL
ncbi:hypothetical protein Ptr902_02617 [Pyrenophora tritici-repentis]|nr:hypothetical protein Ptr902_02617 [Pyrenophora tritici-repentis]